MKASIIFFPNEAKKNSKNDRILMYMRICFRRTKAENRLNAEMSQTELSIWKFQLSFYEEYETFHEKRIKKTYDGSRILSDLTIFYPTPNFAFIHQMSCRVH
jgi:hypothetical protein